MKTVYGLVAREDQVHRIVHQLTAAGITQNDISLLMPDAKKQYSGELKSSESAVSYQAWKDDKGNWNKNLPEQLGIEGNTKAPEGGVIGATTGGLLGGAIGLLAGIGTLAIPGLGAFVAAGPIIAALSGSAIGGSVGLLLGSLIASGIPEYEAKQLEAGLKQGHTLISINTKDDQEDHVKKILEKEGATSLCSSAVASKS